MKHYRAPILISMVFLLIIAALPAWSSPKDYLERYCNRRREGIIGGICQLRERVIDLEQSEGNGSSLYLYDANAQDLGILIDQHSLFDFNGYHLNTLIGQHDHGFTTFSEENEVILSFSQSNSSNNVSSAKVLPSLKTIFFDDVGCTGNSFIDTTQGSWEPQYMFTATSSSGAIFSPVYRVKKGSVLEPKTAVSRLDTISSPCVPASDVVNSAIDVEEFQLPFTEPLAWPLRVEVN